MKVNMLFLIFILIISLSCKNEYKNNTIYQNGWVDSYSVSKFNDEKKNGKIEIEKLRAALQNWANNGFSIGTEFPDKSELIAYIKKYGNGFDFSQLDSDQYGDTGTSCHTLENGEVSISTFKSENSKKYYLQSITIYNDQNINIDISPLKIGSDIKIVKSTFGEFNYRTSIFDKGTKWDSYSIDDTTYLGVVINNNIITRIGLYYDYLF